MNEENSELTFTPIDSTSLNGGGNAQYVLGKCIYTSDKGFSKIFLARKGGRLFVLKGIREDFRNDPIALAALEKEFEISFTIDIPGAVRTYDILSHPEIGRCVVLQYYSGSDLREIINSSIPLSIDDVNGITDSLVPALKSIHASGIAHRDIKPSNIIYNPETHSATLIDFGCADSYDQLNFKGEAGTVYYKPNTSLSPTASDWYALGLTLRQLLPLVSDKAAKSKLSGLCINLVNGSPTDEKDNGGHKKFALILTTILSIFPIIITFVIIYNHYNSQDTATREANYSSKIFSVSEDSLTFPQEEKIGVSDLDRSSSVNNDKSYEITTDVHEPINSSVESSPQNTDSALLYRTEPLTERYKRLTGKTVTDMNDPDFLRFKNEEDKKAEAARQAQYAQDWNDLREVNFNDSPNNPNRDLLKLIKDAETGIYLDARMEIQRRCYSSKDLTSQQRDSIKFSIIDEKKITDAIKAKISPKLHKITPAPDQATIDRLVRKRYLSTFSHLLKKGDFKSN